MAYSEDDLPLERALQYYRRASQLCNAYCYSDAVTELTQAIENQPMMFEAFHLRGICYRDLFQLELAEADYRKAIDLGCRTPEIYHALGNALAMNDKYEEAIVNLQKAYDTVRFNNSTASKVELFWKSLARVKYFFWSYNKALQDKELEHVQKELEQAKDPLTHDAREIPPHFRCCISFDLFRDPVVAPSGVSFERNKILEYLKKSKEDPTTRQPLDESQLYPNNYLRDAVDAFLERNWWAFYIGNTS